MSKKVPKYQFKKKYLKARPKENRPGYLPRGSRIYVFDTTVAKVKKVVGKFAKKICRSALGNVLVIHTSLQYSSSPYIILKDEGFKVKHCE